MRQLTFDEKIEIIDELIEEMEATYVQFGLCFHLKALIERRLNIFSDYISFPDLFPEFRHRTKRFGEYWWQTNKRGYEARVKWLLRLKQKLIKNEEANKARENKSR